MAIAQIKPVMTCGQCGAVFTVAIETYQPDPEGKLLRALALAASEQKLCEWCEQKKAWYYSQGRSEEWEKQVQ